jgi:hypothetical protein
VVKEKASLAARREELATRTQGLKEWEATLQKREMALQKREVKVEELLAERSVGIDWVVRWVGEANPSLDAHGLSPIQVAEAPPSLGTVLLVLDSATECLRHMESAVLYRLETEGRVVTRATVEYILTYFRSHDPTMPFEQRRWPHGKECKRRRTSWCPASSAAPDVQREGIPPDHQNNRSSSSFLFLLFFM